MRIVIGVLLVAALVLPTWAQSDLPMSVFVVHCEPTNASEILWAELVDLVSLADRYRVPLTIDFTAQWAEMILGDETKIAALDAWLDAGHEIACHHHPYWTLIGRGANWDGYTNTPLDEIPPADRSEYRGTMADYMTLLNALPGERRSGCVGGSDARDEADWPCQLVYSTAGHALEEAVSRPTERSFGDCEALEVSHTLIVEPPRGALRSLYESTASGAVFGVIGHVYDYAAFPPAFVEWFSFLEDTDPAAARRTTVSSLLEGYARGGGAD